MTIYGRMTWGLSLLTLLTLGVSFVVISIVLDRYQERQLDQALLQVARAEAEEAPHNHFSFSSRPGPAANDIGPLDKYGVIYDETGKVLSATHPFDSSPPNRADLEKQIDTPFDFVFSHHRLRGVVVPIPGYPNRRLMIAASRDDLEGDSRFVRQAMAISLAVAVLWLIGAIGWVVRRSMGEHKRIADTLHRIAAGDVKVRVSEAVSDQELRRVGTDIDVIAEHLARLIDHQRRFITYAAHELRSPLAALHGEIQQALRKERSAEEYRVSLTAASKASSRLKHLADELLELARAERASKEIEAVSVETALAEATDGLQPLAREKDVTVEHQASDYHVRATNSDVGRILRNLLDNAIRHTPPNSLVRLTVDEAEDTDETVTIRVWDEGSGVLPEERQRIFEPFHRSPDARAEARGTGLGLSIARELARKHGGDLHVAPGPPTCFILTLPRLMDRISQTFTV